MFLIFFVPDSDEVAEIGYFVARTVNQMLPVYARYDRVRDQVTLFLLPFLYFI